jgi:hypothetical protein
MVIQPWVLNSRPPGDSRDRDEDEYDWKRRTTDRACSGEEMLGRIEAMLSGSDFWRRPSIRAHWFDAGNWIFQIADIADLANGLLG